MNTNETATATIHSETAAKINFACHQSSFAFLRELRIENKGSEERLDDVLVKLSSNPAFLKPKSWALDRIAPEEIRPITDRDIELDGAFLLELADSMSGVATITVERNGTIIADQTKPVELLAYNEWGGAGYMPELLAAFSMPNDPAVDRVLRDASLILRAARKPDGIDGYKSGSRQRVWEITSAIYTAICNLGITYALPPASFERDGQKIRLPGQILENRVATCLDSTMLFASALEQAGLNPIVALPHEHALAGVWLQPEELATIVVDEAEILRKRIQLKELLLFETTYVTSHPAPPFSKAAQAAEQVITPDRDDTFNSAIDIRRARAHRILPLGRKSVQPEQAAASADGPRVELTLEEAPGLPAFDEGLDEEELPETPQGRLERWQRKLLDLSARNPLLNHRSTKTSLSLIWPEAGRLEDKLADGARISIHSVPKPTSQAQDEELHLQRTGEVIVQEYAREALEKKQVLVDLPSTELSRRAVSIYRKAQTALQEGGANTLYLALGFLLWKLNEKDSRRFRAPLILLPVTMIRESVRSGVRIVAHDDEPRFNTTLLEMLRKDFQIDIRGLDGVLPEDLSGVDVNGVWNNVRRAVKDAPGFEVVEDVVLGHFSFAKYLMWKDLVDRTEALRSSAIVKHLIDTPRDSYPSEIAFVDGADIDRRYKPSDLLAPLPTDSSQMAVIATADAGKDFVIIGPPGTGKSQTISNLIAHMLGKGKTVLFVSEKTAALEVVYRRLNDVGLGQFALELHSNKARKLDVLNQLGGAWEYHRSADAQTWKTQAEQLKRLRDQLNVVVNRLHLRRRNGMTAFEAMGIRVRDENLAHRVTLSWPSADHHDEACLSQMRETVEELRIQAAAIEDISDSPFRLVTTGDWSPQWQNHLVQQASALSAAVLAMERECERLLDAIDIRVPDRTMARIDALAELAETLQESWRKQTAYALEPDGPERIEALDEAAVRLRSYAEAQAALSCNYDPMAWRRLDGEDIARRWRDAGESWLIKRVLGHRLVTTGDWSPQWQSHLVQQASALSATVLAMERECERLLDAIDIRVPDRTMARIDALAELAETLQESWRKQTAYALEPDGPERIEALDEAAVRLKSYAEAQAALSCNYDPMAWRRLDGEDIARRWRDAGESWLIKRVLGHRRVIKDMKEAGARGSPDPERDAPTLSQLREHGEAIDRLGERLSGFTDWQGHTTRPDALLALRALGQRAQDAVGKLADDAPSLLDTRTRVKTLLLDGNDLLAPEAAIGRATHDFLNASRRLQEDCNAFEALAGQSVREHFAENHKALETIRETADTIACCHRVIKDIKEAGARGSPDPERDAPTLSQLREHGEAIDRLGERLSGFTDWQGHTTRPDALLALRALGQRAQDAVGRLADDAPSLLDTRTRVKTLLLDGNDLLAPEAAIGRATHDFLNASRRLQEDCNAFEALAGQSVCEHFAENHKALETIRETADTIACRHHELKAWCDWWRRRTQAMDLQLAPLVSAIERGQVPTDEIEATFEAAYCSWWSGAVIGEDDVLRKFSTPEHVSTIENFRKIDDRFQKLTAAYIGTKLAGHFPASDSVMRRSSWGVLRHEIQKKRRHKPVRQLMAEIPDVVTTLTPCLMMSPLSVAQYLAADQALFDLVIFDEASQITVWDAVGCLARARQAIVVGDPKQMPPTNFFGRTDDDPDGDIDMEGDLESILDEMLGASIPERTLSLHYRSRKESLIAFSNSRYYDDQLITFPAPIYPDKGVRLIRPDGFYARGKARHNQGEAKAIVAEILRRLTHEDPSVRKQSIGVVTFNSEQQTLIEDLLDQARSSHPHIEWAFAPDSDIEPVFVKNLETVQGDERDVIMFSVTYGPDQANHVTMNFGPLNRDGGERRLNVAISRSRSEMLVFSTLSPDRIDLSRTQARAVSDLKHFLEYAERGPAALGAAVHGSMDDFESPFETAVARALRDKGWEVRPQVGLSAYRIDLGIVHPDAPGAYLAGVECDGAMYHSSAFARERDKIRQTVLEGLGWTLFRVWSMDWWTHRAKAIDILHHALTVQLHTDRQRREKAAQALDADEVRTPVSELLAQQQAQCTLRSNANDSSGETTLPQTPEAADDLFGASGTQYVATRFDGARHLADPDMFHSDEYLLRLSAMIDHVIDSEGPIHQDVLVRRVARHHGFRRVGRQIRERVIKIAKRRWGRSTENVGLFFWRKGTVKDRLAPARHKGRDDEMRNIEYICLEELRAIRESLSLNDDTDTLARRMGIERLSQRARQRLMDAFDG